MRIAPLADVKARLSAYLDECGVEGPVVITRNGKAAAVLLVPYDDDDLERLMLGRSPRFQRRFPQGPNSSQGGRKASRFPGRSNHSCEHFLLSSRASDDPKPYQIV